MATPKQGGFSLIEALVAILILSVGLLGIAGMQLKALQSATVGYQHSLITLAAIDAQERVWDRFAESVKCGLIDDEAVEQAWRGHWRVDSSSNPLRGVDWDNSSVERTSGDNDGTGKQKAACGFDVSIALGDGPGGVDESNAYSYTFTLPPINFSSSAP